VWESLLRGKFLVQKLKERKDLMRIAAVFLLCMAIAFTGCAGNKPIRDIDYEAEFDKGKAAFNKTLPHSQCLGLVYFRHTR
jgi:hypothetical protein